MHELSHFSFSCEVPPDSGGIAAIGCHAEDVDESADEEEDEFFFFLPPFLFFPPLFFFFLPALSDDSSEVTGAATPRPLRAGSCAYRQVPS